MVEILDGVAGKWNLSTIYSCAAESVTVYIVDNLSFSDSPLYFDMVVSADAVFAAAKAFLAVPEKYQAASIFIFVQHIIIRV